MTTATIKDVAKKAGVSTATVSRVLNNAGYFDPDTARRVQEAVEALGYRRNVHWERLVRQESCTVCFLLGNRASLNSMQVKMLLACERVMAEAGYDVVFSLHRYDAEMKAGNLPLPRLLAQRGSVDGVILAGVHHDNFLDALDKLKLPYVIVGNTYIGRKEKLKQDAIVYDDVAGCSTLSAQRSGTTGGTRADRVSTTQGARGRHKKTNHYFMTMITSDFTGAFRACS
jgi:DNA-binding LacI/PurR family transcriptional regulator